ncbi:MAG: hypothetical protein ACYCZS_08810 [Thiobacillus sp.]
MNADTLHAVDILYLQAFRQNLLADIQGACFSLKHHLRQSESLAMAQELPAAFQRNYGEIAERLAPLISALCSVLDKLEGHRLSCQSALNPADSEIIAGAEAAAAIAKLDAAEHQILDVLNDVGKSLAALPSSFISWDDSARLKTCVSLQRLAERPCYDLAPPVELRIHPFLIAEYAATSQPKRGRWPHYLVDEMVPAGLLPWVDGIRIEVEVRGEGNGFGSGPAIRTEESGRSAPFLNGRCGVHS